MLARRVEEAQTLAALVRDQTPAQAQALPMPSGARVPDGTDILVNATSVGLYPDVDAMLDVDLGMLAAGALVADVVPNPPRTRLLREADARGLETLDGLGMLVEQGAVNMRLWTGVDPDRAVMRVTLEGIFGA